MMLMHIIASCTTLSHEVHHQVGHVTSSNGDFDSKNTHVAHGIFPSSVKYFNKAATQSIYCCCNAEFTGAKNQTVIQRLQKYLYFRANFYTPRLQHTKNWVGNVQRSKVAKVHTKFMASSWWQCLVFQSTLELDRELWHQPIIPLLESAAKGQRAFLLSRIKPIDCKKNE